MQLLNNLRQPGMIFGDKNRTKIIAILFFTVLICLLLVATFLKNKPVSDTKNEYVDKGSGETVSDPKGKAPETYGSTVKNPILFLGFSNLLSHGLVKTQHDEVKSLLQEYSDKNQAGFKELSLATDSISVATPDAENSNSEFIVKGQITANRTQAYALELHYKRISTIRLVLMKDGAPIYDSGLINLQPPEDTYED